MERLKQFLSRIRLVYRPSSLLLKCIVTAMLIITTLTLLVIRGGILDMEKITDARKKEAAALESKNRELAQYIGRQNTVDGIKKIAREELGLVDPDSVIFEATD